MKRFLPVLLVAIIRVSGNVLQVFPAWADGDSNEWTKEGIETGRWSQEPGTGAWTDSPVLGNDGYIYSYDLMCFEGDVGYLLCLDANSCDEGPTNVSSATAVSASMPA